MSANSLQFWGKQEPNVVEPMLQVIVHNLRAKNDEGKLQAAKNLQNYVTAQSREMSAENFKRWITSLLKTHIRKLITSQLLSDCVGGLLAVDALIDVVLAEGEAASIIANYLHKGLQHGDPQVMSLAAKGLGHLSRDNSTITAGLVEFEIKTALEWFQGERQENKRHAACLVLTQLAQNSPTLFYAYAQSFIDLVWVVLRDPKPIIRECAVNSLRACLDLLVKRELRVREQSCQQIYDEAIKGLTKQNSTDSIHGSLLVIGALLSHADHFMRDKYNETCQIVLRYKDHKDKWIRRTVISLFPQLAEFSTEIFINQYLADCLNFLILALKNNVERPTTFIAVGEIAIVVGSHIKPYLETIIGQIKIGLVLKGKSFSCSEALITTSMLAKAVGSNLVRFLPDVLQQMFSGELSEALADSLLHLAEYIPEIANDIKSHLLDMISYILCQKPFNRIEPLFRTRLRLSTDSTTSVQQKFMAVMTREERDKLVALALNTLGTFNFSGFSLTEFLRETVVKYLKDPNVNIRKEAVNCCCNIMANSHKNTQGYYGALLNEVLEKLLNVVASDSEVGIRRSILHALDSRFDHYLSQSNNLRLLFLSLGDEVYELKELALSIICRIAPRNPAYVLPVLRTTLTQLLTKIELSGDNLTKEESSKLLGNLIRDCPSLIQTYSSRITKTLLPKLRDEDTGVASSVLATIGELSSVNGSQFVQHLDDLVTLIIETLQDQSSASKREVALHTLGLLAESTGYVIIPYNKYPKLLDILINQIQSERNVGVRREVLKVFGILGALDPYKHRMNQLTLEGRQQDEEGTGRSLKVAEENEESIANLSPSSEDYYPTIVIASLMRILQDSSLSVHHSTVIHVLMSIVKALGVKSNQFLPQIMPPLLQTIRTCEPELRMILFQQLGQLVARVKQHIRDYLDELFRLIHQYWDSPNLTQIITLIEEISLALGDEFKPHLSTILPRLLQVFPTDASPQRISSSKALQAFQIFGIFVGEHLHLIIPVILKCCDQPDTPVKLQIEAIQTLGALCKKFDFSTFSIGIIHPLTRLLDIPHLELQREAMKTLCIMIRQLGTDYLVFESAVELVIARRHIVNIEYDTLVDKLKEDQPLDNSTICGDTETSKGSEQSLDDDEPLLDPLNVRKKEKLNEQNLKRAWEISQRSTREDWGDWLRKFSIELLRESPSPALRSCISLATDYHPIVKELFNAAFVSCWFELTENYQDELVRSLETALSSPNIPAEILQTVLNLAEFMEQDEKPLPIDSRTLGEYSEMCHAYAKALHYKEMEFRNSPLNTIEALISINNQLQLPESALGILIYAQKHYDIELKESWYEKLQRWRQALEAYEKRQSEGMISIDIMLGKMRCYHALGEWEQLATLSQEMWSNNNNQEVTQLKKQVAPLASAAAWNLSNWDMMTKYVDAMEDTVDKSFFRAILSVHKNKFEKAQKFIEKTRSLVDTELTSLVGESYSRAYRTIVRVQQLTELEEVIKYKQYPEKRSFILDLWKQRLEGCERDPETWHRLLAVRSLVLSPIEDVGSWLKFASLCRKNNREDLARKTLIRLLPFDPTQNAPNVPLPTENPVVTFEYIKHMWISGTRELAYQKLRMLAPAVRHDSHLQARIHFKLGEWQSWLTDFQESSIPNVISSFHTAINFDSKWYKAWNAWALANYKAAAFYEKLTTVPLSKVISYVVPALHGFFKSIVLSRHSTLQDVLRLLGLWFKYGSAKEVDSAMTEGFQQVSVDTWLQVIPQIIARIHTTSVQVRRSISDLLISVGKEHPQSLVYSLSVASKAQSTVRVTTAAAIIDKIRKHNGTLVDQAQMVSTELIRCSILWHQMWHSGIEEASRLCYADHDYAAMLSVLRPLHEMLQRGPETIKEAQFQQAYGKDLQDAEVLLKKWERTQSAEDLRESWSIYFKVFRRIDKQLTQITMLELPQISAKLAEAKDMELAVPGTYRSGHPIVRIKGFSQSLFVFGTKQRPRKLVVHGSDGADYMFLLKGHEDLRQDERVMQLFGLVNNLLSAEYETSKAHLSIQRYSVIPLSPNSGLIGWVPHCDTLHHLIRDYRDARKILINVEHRLMQQIAPDYDNHTIMQKVEAFAYAQETTSGRDLERILWLKSGNSEEWLNRRINFTRSLAVMSMVGYILGLGDRHPSNIMLDRHMGRVVHIDFGDCFEVAMYREKYPEKIPFRLTRMLINAMEVSGIEGTFRFTCEKVMKVIRDNKESLLAVLEAFVYDPLINWRLLATENIPLLTSQNNQRNVEHPGSLELPGTLTSGDTIPEVLNRKALQVINRVSKKLTGRDFGEETLDIPEQVERLIAQATSYENLCEGYVGWCPFW